MDSKMQASQRAIGGASDVAQLALSYYFDRTNKGIYDEETQQIYENIIILAVLAQIAIDGCKRIFAVDPTEEIKRIRRMPCMKREKDYPRFMEFTHTIPMTKNGSNRDYEDIINDKHKLNNRIDKSIVCPMNWMEEFLDKIQAAPYLKSIPTEDFFVWEKGRANSRHLGKVRRIVEEYADWVRQMAPLLIESNNEAMNEYFVKSSAVIDELKGVHISKVTMNHLIASCLGIDKTIPKKKLYKKASRYTRKMLNLLYKANREMFLSCWKTKDENNESATA